ncbi:MAG: DUF2461 domain-containing protein [Bacteroidota bacterium]
MIRQESIEFLYDLRANNSKEWFDQNRERYQKTRTNFIDVSQAIINSIEAFDEKIAETQLDPKKTMMRINRDIRFSKDKTPYNSHLFTYINEGGKKTPTAGYFFSFDPGQSFYGAGAYKPPTDILNQMRQEIDYNPEEWKELVSSDNLKSRFGEIISTEQLSRPPKGYDKAHPLLDWIKRKDFYVKKSISDEELLDGKIVEKITEDLKATSSLVNFLNRR